MAEEAVERVNNLIEAFELAVAKAEESKAKGDYAKGAVLVERQTGQVLYSEGNDVASNEPTGLQAEHEVLRQYEIDLAQRPTTTPPPEDVVLVSTSNPSAVVAGMVLALGVNEFCFANTDDFAGYGTNPDQFSPSDRLQAKDVFKPLEIGDKKDQISQDRFDYISVLEGEARAAVGERKKSARDKLGDTAPVTFDTIPEGQLDQAKTALLAAQGREIGKEELSLGNKCQNGKANNSLVAALISKGQESTIAGNEYNAAALLDADGNVLMVLGDRSKDTPTQTPIMRVINAAHRMMATADALNIDIPHISQCKIVSLQEPNLMELGELSRPTMVGTEFLLTREQGMQTSGVIRNMPPFYGQKYRDKGGLENAIQQVQERALVETARSGEAATKDRGKTP